MNKEIHRSTNVVRTFPYRDSIIRLGGAVLAEQHDEWAKGRHYMNLDVLAESHEVALDEASIDGSKEVTTTDPATIAAPQNRRITKVCRTPSKRTRPSSG